MVDDDHDATTSAVVEYCEQNTDDPSCSCVLAVQEMKSMKDEYLAAYEEQVAENNRLIENDRIRVESLNEANTKAYNDRVTEKRRQLRNETKTSKKPGFLHNGKCYGDKDSVGFVNTNTELTCDNGWEPTHDQPQWESGDWKIPWHCKKKCKRTEINIIHASDGCCNPPVTVPRGTFPPPDFNINNGLNCCVNNQVITAENVEGNIQSCEQELNQAVLSGGTTELLEVDDPDTDDSTEQTEDENDEDENDEDDENDIDMVMFKKIGLAFGIFFLFLILIILLL